MDGLFFVFEGIDGSGQDTQAEVLEKRLESIGYSVWLTREPSDGLIGVKLREILRNKVQIQPSPETTQLLMSQDRRYHVEEIRQHLGKSEIVICVRYLYSTLAYGQADGINYQQLWDLNHEFIRPHIAIYLDLDPVVAMRRIEQRGKPMELFERQEFLTKVRQYFNKLCDLDEFLELKRIQAGGSIEQVSNSVWRLVEQAVNKWDRVQKPK